MRLVILSFPAILALALLACGGQKKADTSPMLRPVRAEQVFATGAARTRTFSGVARAGVESKISFKVKGTINRLSVEVGDEVRMGQLIAELDPTDYRLQVEDASASLDQARAQRRNASAEYERVRGLYENRNASKQDLDAARAASESADATVESIEKRLELAQRQLAYCRLTAPIAGSIASLDVEPNENVQPGQVICLLASTSNTEVEVAIPEVLIAQVKEGDEVNVEFDALPERRMTGHVTEVGVASTGLATTFPVRVRLDKDDDDVRSGMAAEVEFRFGDGGGRVRYLVRPVAVCEDRDGRYVWVVVPTEEVGVGQVQRRPVTIGELSSEGIEILEGISDGDFVVTAGVSKLTDGRKVRFGFGGGE
jgi:multidrug efflux system membrane fusion protein